MKSAETLHGDDDDDGDDDGDGDGDVIHLIVRWFGPCQWYRTMCMLPLFVTMDRALIHASGA